MGELAAGGDGSEEGMQPPSPLSWGISASWDASLLAELLAERRRDVRFAGEEQLMGAGAVPSARTRGCPGSGVGPSHPPGALRAGAAAGGAVWGPEGGSSLLLFIFFSRRRVNFN